MRVKVTLEHPEGKEVAFPLYYNYALQGFIYRHLSSELATFLHNEGYPLEKRKFKFFTFSRLLGKFRINSKEEKISFIGPVSFYLSSPKDQIIQQFADTLLRFPEVTFSRNQLIISNIEAFPKPSLQDDVTIRMLSPLTVYSTLFSANGKKKTYYYSPFEEEFSQLLRANILKKYQALQGKPYPEKSNPSYFEISPQKIGRNSEKIIKYTPSAGPYTLIKAWLGRYRIQGNSELISLAYDTGLGSKNSQGFGMFAIL